MQPAWADVISEIASYGALIPVAVITIYSMTMLVWGSRYQWTLASTLLYIGFAGWAIGGVGAVIDSLIPINFRLHNTTWVVAHFHTYLILTVVVWGLAFLAHLLERDAGPTSSRAARTWTVGLILVGGYGLTGHLVRRGCARRPAPLRDPTARHQRLQPRRQRASRCCSRSAFSSSSLQLVPLARDRAGSGATTCSSSTSTAGPARIISSASAQSRPRPAAERRYRAARRAAREPGAARLRRRRLRRRSRRVLPSDRRRLRGEQPLPPPRPRRPVLPRRDARPAARLAAAISRRLGDHSSIGLATVLVAPMLMMLVMVPRFYEPLERHPFEHALYHLAMAAFGLVHRPRRDPSRPRHRPADVRPLGRDAAHVRRRHEMNETRSDRKPATTALECGRALALAARRPRRRRHHPRTPDRRLRDRLPPGRTPRCAPSTADSLRRRSCDRHTTTDTRRRQPCRAVTATSALVARGKTLYTSDGCSACHSLTGTAGAGPSLKGLAGGTITLANGQTVTADDAYLEQSIADPDAQIVKGYRAGFMSAAIASYDLNNKPDDVRALVAFIKSLK